VDEIKLTVPESIVESLPEDSGDTKRDIEQALIGWERRINAILEVEDDEELLLVDAGTPSASPIFLGLKTASAAINPIPPPEAPIIEVSEKNMKAEKLAKTAETRKVARKTLEEVKRSYIEPNKPMKNRLFSRCM